MARICGICPVSHLIASSKACDQILAVEPPPTGADLRRVMNLAQIVQSNALSFFHLSSPDLLFGFDADPARRNILGVAQADPQLARDGVGVRRFGQQIIEWLGGKRIHPSWVVPGGVDAPLSAETRDRILATIPEAIAAIERALAWYKSSLVRMGGRGRVVRRLPVRLHGRSSTRTATSSTTTARCASWTPTGNLLADGIDPRTYTDYLGEAVEPWSYLKSTYWKSLGYPDGRLPGRAAGASDRGRDRWARHAPTASSTSSGGGSGASPAARSTTTTPGSSTSSYATERIEELLRGPDILLPRVRSFAGVNSNEGIGVSEAPRGTLLHHYRVDDDGIVQWANLVIATGHNNLAMNRSVLQVAKRYVEERTADASRC